MGALDFKSPLAMLMFANNSPVLVKATASDPRFRDAPGLGRSFIAAPFLHDDNLLGFLFLSNASRENAFTNNQMVLVSTLCSLVGDKINDLERRKEELLKRRLKQRKL